jgi:hypothetical protein
LTTPEKITIEKLTFQSSTGRVIHRVKHPPGSRANRKAAKCIGTIGASLQPEGISASPRGEAFSLVEEIQSFGDPARRLLVGSLG